MSDPIRLSLAKYVGVATHYLKEAASQILALLMIGLTLLLGANIILRYWFDSPIAWSNTISRYAYIFIVLVGSGIAYVEEGHARIDLVYDRAGRKTRKGFNIFHCVLMMAVSIGFMVMGTRYAISMWGVHAPIIPWLPVGAVYMSIPVMALLIFLYLLKKLLSL